MTEETKTGQTVPGSEAAEAEPAWFAEAWNLSEQGVSAADVAKAVGKRAADVRKLIKRKKEAIEAEQAALDADPSRVVESDAPAEDSAPAADPTPDGDPDGEQVQAGAEVTTPPAKVSTEQAERLRGLAGDSSGDDPPQAELFPDGSVDGDGVTLKTLIKPNMTVTHSVHMTGHEVPIPKGSGLLDPAKDGYLLVGYEVSDAGKPVPIREGERGQKKITGYHIKQQVRPIHLERLTGEEGVIEGHFAALLEASQTRAGAVLDRLLVRAGRKLES